MYLFNETTINADRGIIFLCGSNYVKRSVYDKRNVLKKFIEAKYPRKSVLILEEHFVFGKRKGYLSYDDIFLKDLNDIELLSAAFASGIIIIHDSISTGAELAAFASNRLLQNKICVLEPDSTGIEEHKISSFLELAFFRQDSGIHRIVYYPEVYSFDISEKHIEKRTNFAGNSITPVLGRKICDFIDQCRLNLHIQFEKMKYNKPSNDPGVISYSETDGEIQVYISGQVVLYQVIGLLSIQSIRMELRTKKEFHSHVDFVCRQYKKILHNTIQRNLNTEAGSIQVNIKELNVQLRNVIAYSLYMLQALGLISMSEENELCKFSLKKNLDVLSDGLQGIIREEDHDLLEFL